MSLSTSIPKTAGRRRSHTLPVIAAIAAVIALAAWAIATYLVNSATRSVRSSAATQTSPRRQLTPAGRAAALRITSMNPIAFGTSPTPPVHHGGSGGTPAAGETKSPSLALPILPACGPGPCWRGATSTGRQR